jgi:K+-sensing histidine kinase KdpD
MPDHERHETEPPNAQDLLNALRVQAGARLQLDITHCDLVDVVRQTLARLQTEHGDRFVLVATEPVHGYLAPDALQRAVENLTDNAVKYGAPSAPVTVSVSETMGRREASGKIGWGSPSPVMSMLDSPHGLTTSSSPAAFGSNAAVQLSSHEVLLVIRGRRLA